MKVYEPVIYAEFYVEDGPVTVSRGTLWTTREAAEKQLKKELGELDKYDAENVTKTFILEKKSERVI